MHFFHVEKCTFKNIGFFSKLEKNYSHKSLSSLFSAELLDFCNLLVTFLSRPISCFSKKMMSSFLFFYKKDEIDIEWFNASRKSLELKNNWNWFINRTELYQIFNNGMVERVKSIPSSLCGDLVCHSWWTHYAREQRYCYIPISMLNEFNPDVCVSNQKNISSHREGPPSD